MSDQPTYRSPCYAAWRQAEADLHVGEINAAANCMDLTGRPPSSMLHLEQLRTRASMLLRAFLADTRDRAQSVRVPRSKVGG